VGPGGVVKKGWGTPRKVYVERRREKMGKQNLIVPENARTKVKGRDGREKGEACSERKNKGEDENRKEPSLPYSEHQRRELKKRFFLQEKILVDGGKVI